MSRSHYSREKCEEILNCAYDGLIGEGISESTGLSATQVASFFKSHRFSLTEIRKLKREGVTREKMISIVLDKSFIEKNLLSPLSDPVDKKDALEAIADLLQTIIEKLDVVIELQGGNHV